MRQFPPGAVYAARIAVLAALYFAVGKIGFSLDHAYHSVTSLWAPSGIALAAALHGYRFLPGVWVGALAVPLSTGLPLPVSLGIACGNTLGATLGAFVLTRFWDFHRACDRVRDVLGLAGPGAITSAVTAATAGSFSLALGGKLPWDAFARTWGGWVAADALGIVLLTPALLAAGAYPFRWRGTGAFLLVLLASWLLSYVIFYGSLSETSHYEGVKFLLFPLLAWVALRFAPAQAAVAILLVAGVAVWGTAHGTGPFAGSSHASQLITLYLFLSVTSLTTLILSSLAAQSRSTELDLRESEARLKSLIKLSADWYWEQDRNFRLIRVEQGGRNRETFDYGQGLGKTRWEVPYLQASEDDWAKHKATLQAHQPFYDFELKRTAQDGSVRYISISGEPVFDADGTFVGYRGVGRDVTERRHAEEALRESEQRLRTLIEYAPDAIVIVDADTGTFVEANANACRLYGLERHELLKLCPARLSPPLQPGGEPSRRIIAKRLREALAGGAPRFEWTIRSTKGALVPCEVHLVRLPGNRNLVRGSLTDITERKQAEAALRESEETLRTALDAAGMVNWEWDLAADLIKWGPGLEKLLGPLPQGADCYPDFHTMVHPEDREAFLQAARQAVAQAVPYACEFRLTTTEGQTRWISARGRPLRDGSGLVTRLAGVSQDITERVRAEQQIEELATRDPLTGLPNRVLLHDRLSRGLANAQRAEERLALLFIDLDRFKNINDSLGHHTGDALLREVAQRLTQCMRRGDTLSRLGGDEFVVALEGLRQAQDATQVAHKILSAIARPYAIEGHTLNTSCSIGISVYPDDGEDIGTLMRNADTAMYHAKEKGRNTYQFFSADMNAKAVERLTLENALRRALEREEFVLYYQPQVSLRTGQVVGAEALVRWQHPEKGLIAPDKFIPVAEESGLIVPLGEWVLAAACAQGQAWREAGHAPLRLAVNLSVGQLNPGLGKAVAEVIGKARIEPRLLELEVTETLLMHNVEDNISILRSMGELGVQVAIDDFGTGYSSLSYLRRLPIDALKIDRSFVREVVTNPDDVAITTTIIAMAHSMDLRVIAEGVESVSQLSVLREMKCDEYQGYLFSKPVPANEFEERFLSAPRRSRPS